tara:strand:- start:894 stop:1205 length:312 start_codon:yes stop_codon:yes gene_type:complete
MYFVFRKSDSVILYQSYTAQQASNEWAACLRAEGGDAGDYIRIEAEVDIPAGYVATLNDAQDTVTAVEDSRITVRRQNQESGWAKLRVLGLTDDEIEALGKRA